MSSFITPTTELEAVNIMLQAIKESPVSSLDDEDVVSAGIAQSTLRNLARTIQARGYVWNTDLNRKLLRTTDGKVRLPANTLSVDTTGTSKGVNAVQRGEYLYDRVNHTYTFEEDLYVDLVVALEFDEMTEVARRYVTMRATSVFHQDILGSPHVDAMLQDDIAEAKALLKKEENKTGDHNILSGSIATAAPLSRTHVLRRTR